MKSAPLVLGTRASALAMAQSQWVADQLMAAHVGLQVRLKKITTLGDQIQDRPLDAVGGKGLFVKEIESALLNGDIDLAVHSLKDMPAELPKGLQLGATPLREEPWDVLLSREPGGLMSLPEAARIGTTSLRRRLQLARHRPDLQFEMLRGNIDTRLKRLQQGDFDAIVLAKSGMKRLGLRHVHSLDLDMIPAPGQGTLAIEVREDDASVKNLIAGLHDEATRKASDAERLVMRALGGSCNLPLGAFGNFNGDQFRLKAFIAMPDGTAWIEEESVGAAVDFLKIAERLVERFWELGAREIVEKLSKLVN